MNRVLLRLPVRLLLLAMILAAYAPTPAPTPALAGDPPPQAPRTVTVLVGGGQDTAVLNAFLPQTVRVRGGDTVVWKINGDGPARDTVTFVGGRPPGPVEPLSGGSPGEVIPSRNVPVPGGGPGEIMRNPLIAFPTRRPGAPVETYSGKEYVNSGELSREPRVPGAPANDTFSLTFAKPGIYPYFSLHEPGHMRGIVEVVPAASTDVPDQAEIDAQARVEMAYLLTLVEKAKGPSRAIRSLPGPNGTTFWFVRAGGFYLAGDPRAQSIEFMPKSLTIKAGDTVIWEAIEHHTITFIPSPPAPKIIVPKLQAEGPPLFTLNPKVLRPAKPAGVYDPAQYFNSGVLGETVRRRASWALTFDKPGVYEYFCALHREMGMKGAITVLER